ncbi:hypothetical protein PTSG_09946 [Salpingoeca rosetta]|uniref:F-BAR domain-containing protein n=1 Tax=Salpingoeca rosetta (strain ATCC 50818 / BSB-021) TaxID=946362 RepID=F2UNM1_SALR5|nr:uncharacterized protein PTSG_09946 [Salpingoeca rosetta]EGD79226.1 hypothetical protein PTSG_09946 [Salpingoeca rosetta]|eukprot:XP_004989311.1 hypothetical protein PTSG_09946 [Salpingoeca rosetta]
MASKQASTPTTSSSSTSSSSSSSKGKTGSGTSSSNAKSSGSKQQSGTSRQPQHSAAGARRGQQAVKHTPAFWELDGYRLAAKRFDSLAFLLEQLQRMMRDRAALAKKHATELNKFSAKWRAKMQQANMFSNGQFFNAVVASCEEPEVLAHAQLLLADKIINGPMQQAHAEQMRHYQRSFGRLKATTAALQEFRGCESTYSKAVKLSAKHKKAYHSKQEAVLKLEEQKAQAGIIDSDTINDERRKLEVKLETAKKEAIKTAQKYKEALQAAAKQFNTYAQSMRTVYNAQDATVHTRLQDLLAIFHNYVKTVDFEQTTYKQDQRDLLRKFTSVDLKADLSSYRSDMGVDQAPPQITFQEAPTMKSAGVINSEVMSRLQDFQKQEKKPAAWFVKSGDTGISFSHKRYFVLDGHDLVYFSSANLGVPGNKKGLINLDTARQMYVVDNSTLVIETPGRLWKLHSKRPQLLVRWRDMLCERVGLPKGQTQPSTSPGMRAGVAAAAVGATGAAAATNAKNSSSGGGGSQSNAAQATPAATTAASTLASSSTAAPSAMSSTQPSSSLAATQPSPATASSTLPSSAATTAAVVAGTSAATAYTAGTDSVPSTRSESPTPETTTQDREIQAATKIQAQYRGYRTRKHLKKRDEAARVIQRNWRRTRTSTRA